MQIKRLFILDTPSKRHIQIQTPGVVSKLRAQLLINISLSRIWEMLRRYLYIICQHQRQPQGRRIQYFTGYLYSPARDVRVNRCAILGIARDDSVLYALARH